MTKQEKTDKIMEEINDIQESINLLTDALDIQKKILGELIKQKS